MGKTKKAPPPAPPPLPAKGKGAKKRTPTSQYDPAAKDDELYEPEKIVATKLEKRGGKAVTLYQVKWAGYDSKHNTWEPIKHLAESEDLIAQHLERRKQSDAEAAAVADEKRREKQEAENKKQAELAAAAVAARNAEGTPPTVAAGPQFTQCQFKLRTEAQSRGGV